MKIQYGKICLFISFVFFSSMSIADSLSEAVKIQKQSIQQEQNKLNVEQSAEQTKKNLNGILQSLFYKYYGEVKKSGIKLANAQKEVENLNAQRRRTGGCCDILVSSRLENGMYVVTTDGDGIFAIDGYGLQTVSGIIQDDQFERTGKLSSQCKYEVNISYKNSRTYSCSTFLSRKIDDKVVKDMLEMLPVAMKSYIK